MATSITPAADRPHSRLSTYCPSQRTPPGNPPPGSWSGSFARSIRPVDADIPTRRKLPHPDGKLVTGDAARLRSTRFTATTPIRSPAQPNGASSPDTSLGILTSAVLSLAPLCRLAASCSTGREPRYHQFRPARSEGSIAGCPRSRGSCTSQDLCFRAHCQAVPSRSVWCRKGG